MGNPLPRMTVRDLLTNEDGTYSYTLFHDVVALAKSLGYPEIPALTEETVTLVDASCSAESYDCDASALWDSFYRQLVEVPPVHPDAEAKTIAKQNVVRLVVLFCWKPWVRYAADLAKLEAEDGTMPDSSTDVSKTASDLSVATGTDQSASGFNAADETAMVPTSSSEVNVRTTGDAEKNVVTVSHTGTGNRTGDERLAADAVAKTRNAFVRRVVRDVLKETCASYYSIE